MRKLAFLFILSACSGKKNAVAVIGAPGGALKSTDGALTLAVPAGAVASNLSLTMTVSSAPPAGAVGTVYDIGPDGTKFTAPVALTLSYAGMDLKGVAADTLRLATYVDSAWLPLPDQAFDANAKTISAMTTHLSTYGLVAASNQVCVLDTQYAPCSGGGSGGGSGRDCGTITCAGSTACAAYPSATQQSCVDAGSTFTETCCFGSTTSVCIVNSVGETCSGGGSGSGRDTCTPASCDALSTPCSNWTGSTQQACAAGASSSVNVTCCYPPGTTPVVATPPTQSGGGTQSGSSGGTQSGGSGGSGGATTAG